MSSPKTLSLSHNPWLHYFRSPRGLRKYLRSNAGLKDEPEYTVKGKRYDHWFVLCRDAYGDWYNSTLLEKSWKRRTKKRKQYIK